MAAESIAHGKRKKRPPPEWSVAPESARTESSAARVQLPGPARWVPGASFPGLEGARAAPALRPADGAVPDFPFGAELVGSDAVFFAQSDETRTV